MSPLKGNRGAKRSPRKGRRSPESGGERSGRPRGGHRQRPQRTTKRVEKNNEDRGPPPPPQQGGTQEEGNAVDDAEKGNDTTKERKAHTERQSKDLGETRERKKQEDHGHPKAANLNRRTHSKRQGPKTQSGDSSELPTG